LIIEEFRNIKIAYVRRTGAYGSENQKLMENFKAYLNPHARTLGTTINETVQTAGY